MNLFEELKRRNVFRVAIAYMVIAWVVLQVADLVLDNIGAPDWVMQFMILIMGIGLLISLIVSWAYEMTPEGIKKEKDIIRDEAVAQLTTKKLDILILLALLTIALMFAYDKFMPQSTIQSLTQTDNSPTQAQLIENVTNTKPKSTAPINSIAVLPFAHRSEIKNDEYFTDGIHDDLLTQLAKIQDIVVTSRTSVMQYRDTPKVIKEIAKELNVATILEGGIQRAGKRIRINAQLISVATDEHLWAETYDREMTIDNLFDIQSEITRQIVTAVKGQLTEQDEQALIDAPTQNISAYEAYLKAKEIYNQSDNSYENYKETEQYLQQAINLDAQFALAHILLADVYSNAFWFGYELVEEQQQMVKDSITKAESILPRYSPELMAAQGEYFYRFGNNYGAALNSMLKAHIAMPSNSGLLAQIGYTQRRLGLWEDAVDSLILSQQLDPNNISSLTDAVETLTLLKQWDRLEKLLNSSLDKFKNNWQLNNTAASLPLMRSGDLIKYRELIDDLPVSTKLVNRYYSEINLLIYERNFPRLIEVLNSPEIKINKSNTNKFEKFLLGFAYKRMGDKDKSIENFNGLIAHLNIKKNKNLSSQQNIVIKRLLILSLIETGNIDLALLEMNAIVEQIPVDKDHLIGMNLLKLKAQVLATVGRREEALELIEEIIDQPNGFIRWEMYLHPAWDFFRDDERFNQLIKPHNFDESIHADKPSLVL